jgi:hypothetical protein
MFGGEASVPMQYVLPAKHTQLHVRQGSSLGVVNWLPAGKLRNSFLFPGRNKKFPVLQNVQTGCGTHPASSAIYISDSSSGITWLGYPDDHLAPSTVKVKNANSWTPPPVSPLALQSYFHVVTFTKFWICKINISNSKFYSTTIDTYHHREARSLSMKHDHLKSFLQVQASEKMNTKYNWLVPPIFFVCPVWYLLETSTINCLRCNFI